MSNTDKLSIYYFSSTHWDREWYQSFQDFRYRLVTMMNEMIDYLEARRFFIWTAKRMCWGTICR